LLEKTKYAVLDTELKKGEQILMQQKDASFFGRKNAEDNKVDTIKKRLEKSKQ
jgi:hypothetical protein